MTAQRSRVSGVPIWCEIVCRSCARSCTAANRFTYGRVERRAMIYAAKGAGWLFKYDEAFCSRQCQAIHENGGNS